MSQPPTTGPRIEPTAATIWFTPSARPNCARGKASVTITPLLAIMKAPAAPMKTRATMSCPTPVENPAMKLTIVKSANPAT